MLRSAVGKVVWMARATCTVVGLAIMLALVFGLTTAAFGANGGNFILGQNNVATLITRLAGPDGVDGAMLEVQNNNVGANDTALRLKVQAGEAPMTVNSAAKIADLNADKLDGVDSAAFLRSISIYKNERSTTGGAGPNGSTSAAVGCDAGGKALSGGFSSVSPGTHIRGSSTGTSFSDNFHVVSWQNNATVDTVTISVICADMTP
jgi:hypothetical protein